MTDQTTQPDSQPAAKCPAVRLAMRSAVVAAMFCAVAAAVTIHSHLLVLSADPLDQPAMKTLRDRLATTPNSEELKQQIRDLDLSLRMEYFSRQHRLWLAGWALVAGGAWFALSAGIAVHLLRRTPHPDKVRIQGHELRLGRLARAGIGVLGVLLVVGAGWLAIDSRSGVNQDASAFVNAITEPVKGVVRPPAKFPSPAELVANWPAFRGPGSIGVASKAHPPTDWDGPTGKNILWKKPVPLPSESSPVVWGNRLFTIGATKKTREVFCYNADNGELLWRRPVNVQNSPEPNVPDNETGYAPATPVCDGERVYAMFVNCDIACFDFEGNELWKKNLGPVDSSYGQASSLQQVGDKVIVQLDQGDAADGKSALIAMDAATGKIAWKTPSPNGASWSSPIVINTADGQQIVEVGRPFVVAYDADSGAKLWQAKVTDINDVAVSPAYGGGYVFAGQASANVSAIQTSGMGDVTESHVPWTASEGLGTVPSLVASDHYMFVLGDYGSVTCYDIEKGAKEWAKAASVELDEDCRHPSPVIVGDRLMILSSAGTMHALSADAKLEKLAACRLAPPKAAGQEETPEELPEEGSETEQKESATKETPDKTEKPAESPKQPRLFVTVSATPAFVDGRIYIRTHERQGRVAGDYIYCIGAK